MGLREGKNREIKKVLEHLGLAVNRLIRISFGPFQLGELEEGAVAEVRTRVLRDQLGAKLAREAGVDFDAPLPRSAASSAAASARPASAARRGRRFDRKPRPGGFEEREERAHNDPKTSYGPKMRKHVSTLRAERKEAESGPRKRIARGAGGRSQGARGQGRTIAADDRGSAPRAAVRAQQRKSRTRASKEGPPAVRFAPATGRRCAKGRRRRRTRSSGEAPADELGRLAKRPGPRSAALATATSRFRRGRPSKHFRKNVSRRSAPGGDKRRPRAGGDGKRQTFPRKRDRSRPASARDSKPFHKGPQGKGSARDGGETRERQALPQRPAPRRSGGKPPAAAARGRLGAAERCASSADDCEAAC